MPQSDGTTVTIALQGGEITALSADSLTVESSDGFSRTYSVTADTRLGTPTGTLAGLQVGDTVLVEAVIDGETATATGLRTASSPGGRHAPDDGTATAPETEQDSTTADA